MRAVDGIKGNSCDLEAELGQQRAHVIVVGNEKGGSGKSTLSLHLAVYLLHQGFRVATVDVDSRQQTLTRYIRNRRNTLDTTGRDIPMPKHVHVPTGWSDSIKENQKAELELFSRSMDKLYDEVDFIVIDTPGFDAHLARLAHSAADTLVTPVNDSMIDLDVLAKIDVRTGDPESLSPYSKNVQRARAERQIATGAPSDWVIVRNRISALSNRNGASVHDSVVKIADALTCRVADGIAERVIFRSLFPIGMTVFDPLDAQLLGAAPSMSHVNARQEYRDLVAMLHLPDPRLAQDARLSA
ncbi:AAA family ATPase [Devosia sp. WQ 349]|nr:AAA family ATPase [Devosia sp. WQ 349K1]